MVFKIGETSINPEYVKSSTEDEAVKHLSKLDEKEVRRLWQAVHGKPKKKRTVKKSED
jgi:hypothetical protein